MIQRINDNNYNVYTKPKNLNIPEAGEKFNLNYTHDGTSPETKDKGEVSDSKEKQTTEQGGVRLELSGDGRNAGAHRQRSEEPAEAQSTPSHKPLSETIRTYIVSAINAVRKFFHDIWYDQPSEDAAQEPLLVAGQEIFSDAMLDSAQEDFPDAMLDSAQEDFSDTVQNSTQEDVGEIIDVSDEREALAAYEARRERMILQLLREGNREQAINLLTENGKRTVARNSTLLTSYDKNGKVVETNASDRERTLHGDRNAWKL